MSGTRNGRWREDLLPRTHIMAARRVAKDSLTRAPNNFTGGVRKHFAHAQTVYTRPSPFFWEGPGYEASPCL